MKTPIYDFVKDYSLSDSARFHMPGHKGASFLGCEPFDITEIGGADVLYSPNGIIAESEENASALFESHHTYYSTEGSTLAIKVMLSMVALSSDEDRPLILAARNAHKAFIHACALLDLDAEWLIPRKRDHLCSCDISAEELDEAINNCPKKPSAVYLTSPDYMGNSLDISALSAVCHYWEIPLLVDNAHGAYLAFTSPSAHPLALGADLCCDSAHKTLPVLTGGAYLHVSKNAPDCFKDLSSVRNNFSLFASTSPSYLILSSLDLCNKYLSNGYSERLCRHIEKTAKLKDRLSEIGYTVSSPEPLKLVIFCNGYGYEGASLAATLRQSGIECEFSDPESIVFMTTPENSDADIARLWQALSSIERKEPLKMRSYPALTALPDRVLSIRQAILSKREMISVDLAFGRVCATPTVSCPPAVPIAISGEVITAEHIELFKAYGIEKIEVCK